MYNTISDNVINDIFNFGTRAIKQFIDLKPIEIN